MNPAPLAAAPVDLLAQAGAAQAAPNGKTKEAAKQFEGMLMANLFQSLRKTVTPSGLFGNSGQARSTYEYLLDQAVVNHAMASGKGWGLAEKLEASWNLQNSKKQAAK